MGECQHETEALDATFDQLFKCGDVSSISGVAEVRPLPVSEPCSLNQPMSLKIVLGIVGLGGCRVSLKDLESREHDGTRRRGHGGENAVAAVGDVHRCTGDRLVVLEVVQGYDPTAILGG